MMKSIVLIICLVFYCTSSAQVGINTTTPSEASVLDINSSLNGTHFGGFLLPRVTLLQRDAIPVTSTDDGMLVYVTNTQELQIYDGILDIWRVVFPSFNNGFTTILAGWEMDGITSFGPSPLIPNTASAEASVSGLTRGPGVTTTGANIADNAWGGNGLDTTNQADAILAEDYVYFTITPSLGAILSISSIESYNVRRSANGPTTGIWQYSTDGINFTDIGMPIDWGGVVMATGNPQDAIDLRSIPALQNVTSSTTITFRIVLWGALNANGNWYINRQLAGNDFVISGSY